MRDLDDHDLAFSLAGGIGDIVRGTRAGGMLQGRSLARVANEVAQSWTDEVLAVVQDQAGRRMTLLGWGLVRGWADAAKPPFPLINARAETVRERPAYRDLVAKAENRCLVLADGWYEWQGPEDPRQPRRPVHFSLPDRAPFCFAGLWTGSSSSCTILTCAANDLARPIHDRMPVVLTQLAVWDAWLDPGVAPAAWKPDRWELHVHRDPRPRAASRACGRPRHLGPGQRARARAASIRAGPHARRRPSRRPRPRRPAHLAGPQRSARRPPPPRRPGSPRRPRPP